MKRIYVRGGDSFVWQWQPKEHIILEDYPEGVFVHYANCDTVEAPVVQTRRDGDKLIADIPPELMQVDKDITVYVCDADGTMHCHFLSVLGRPKPESYVTEPVEVLRYESLAERVAALEKGGTGGGITEEKDPTVAAWAKVGNPEPVTSINGKAGAVVLGAEDVGALSKDTKIPKNTSDLSNDAGFITTAVNDLANYYTKVQMQELIAAIPRFRVTVVQQLPAAGEELVLYLVPFATAEGQYLEYIWVDGRWEIIGSQRVDLTGYATEEWVEDYVSTRLEEDCGQNPVQADWAQNDPEAPDYVKGRTHYEENNQTVIEWDGNTEGRESFDIAGDFAGAVLYKVHNDTPTQDELVGGVLCADNGDEVEEVLITSDVFEATAGFNAVNCLLIGPLLIVYGTEISLLGETYTLQSTGIFAATYFHKLTYGSTIVHPLDEKWIPENIARKTDIPKLDATLTKSGAAADAAAVGEAIQKIAGQNTKHLEPADDDIPRMFFTLDGWLPTTKDEGKAQCLMRYVSKTADYSKHVTMGVQGSSSATTPSYKKKNYTMVPYTDESYEKKDKLTFRDWPAMNKFVLKASWVTPSHIRNPGTAEIAGQVTRSRADYATLPEELRNSPNQGATHGFVVRVWVNGLYWGIYELIVAKDKLFGQDKDNPLHSIVNSEWNNQPTCAFATTTPVIGGNWSEELQDSMTPETKTSLESLIKFVAGSTDEEFTANAEQYFDVQSVIDADIMFRLFCVVDNLCRNQIFYKYDKLWYEGFWDLDAVLGLPPVAGEEWLPPNLEFQSGYYAYRHFGITNMLYQRTEECFFERFQTRYWELRSGPLSISNVLNVYERRMDVLKSYDGLLAEDYAATTGRGEFTAMPNVGKDTIQQIRQFVHDRWAYMDEVVTNMVKPVKATAITLSASALAFDSKIAQTITATVEPSDTTDTIVWESTDTTVATVEGGVVTPVSNGNATIRATAGRVSAECAVTVQYATIPCAGINLDKAALELSDRTPQTIVATVTPDNTTDNIVWSSSNPAVATVTGGVVTAVDNGEATITATCGAHSATCAVSVSGLSYDPLSGVEFFNGHAYNETTGEMVARSGDHCTGKFTARNHLHTVTITGSALTIYIWDNEDNYLGYVTGMVGTAAYVNFVDGQKYAIKFASAEAEPDISDITVAIKDNSATAADTATFRLNDLAWNFAQTTTAEVVLTDVIKNTSIADFYQLTNMLVEKANHFMVLGQKANSGSSQPGVMFNIFNFGSTVYMRAGCSGVSLAGYLADNPVDLVINGE